MNKETAEEIAETFNFFHNEPGDMMATPVFLWADLENQSEIAEADPEDWIEPYIEEEWDVEYSFREKELV